MNTDYSRAYTEVLEIIKFFDEDDYNRIPKEKIEFMEAHKDTSYNFALDPSLDIEEQTISRVADSIIVNIYKNYLATPEEVIIIDEILEINSRKEEIRKSQQYDPNKIFDNDKTSEVKSELNSKVEETIQEIEEKKDESLIEYKDSIVIRVWKKILSFFGK